MITMIDHQSIRQLLPGYALDSLDEAESQLVSSHLPTCRECREEIVELQETVDELAFAVPLVEAPPDLKARLMERVEPQQLTMAQAKVESGQQKSPFAWWPKLAPAWGAISLVMILFLGATNLWLWQRVSQLEETSGPGRLQSIRLNNTDAVPEAEGYILVSDDGLSGALVVDNLPVLGEDQQYQLWLIRDGEYTSAAVLSVNERGYGGTRVIAPESLFGYEALSITVEPAGGSQNPSGEQVLTGVLFPDSP